MLNIITSNDNAILTLAMEANLAAFWMGFGQAPTGDTYTDSRIQRFSTIMPHPLFNAAFGGHYPVDQDSDADATVRETTAYFRTRQRSAMWWVSPTSQSPTFTSAIIRGGWHHIGDIPGMILDLQTLDERAASVAGLTIECVEDASSLREWISILGPANDIAPASIERLYTLESTRGFANDMFVRYLARSNGQSVAASAVYYHAGVAGIFAVATDQQVRGRGFGRAVTAAPLLDAKRLGYKFSVLQASELGYPVYQRLGFEHRWTINLFALK
jgi:predicted GNAT family acetyltransferase